MFTWLAAFPLINYDLVQLANEMCTDRNIHQKLERFMFVFNIWVVLKLQYKEKNLNITENL